MSAIPYWSDATPVISVVIAGIFDKKDFEDDVWYVEEKVLDGVDGQQLPQPPPSTYPRPRNLGALGPSFSRLSTTYAWLLDVDNDRVTARKRRVRARRPPGDDGPACSRHLRPLAEDGAGPAPSRSTTASSSSASCRCSS